MDMQHIDYILGERQRIGKRKATHKELAYKKQNYLELQ